MIQQRPLLLPFVAMAAGLAVTDQTGYHLPVSAVAAALLCLLLSALVRSRTIFEICVPLFFFVLGLYALSPWKNPATPPGSIRLLPSSLPVTLQGIVTSRPVDLCRRDQPGGPDGAAVSCRPPRRGLGRSVAVRQ